MRCAAALFVGIATGALWISVRAAPPLVPLRGDEQDLILLEGPRPYLLRFHIQADGHAYRSRWDDAVAKLFQYLDTDRDGKLNAQELARAPSYNQLRRMLQNDEDLDPDAAPAASEIAGEGTDGSVTLARLAAYYERTPAAPLIPEWISRERTRDPVSAAFFRYLDTDKDGNLSVAELTAAPSLLDKIDADGDERISPSELVQPLQSDHYVRRALNAPAGGALPPFQLLGAQNSTEMALARLIARYDHDKDGRLDRKEIGFDEATFARLDIDRDGSLDRKELTDWLNGPPDLEVVVRFSDDRYPEIAALSCTIPPGQTPRVEPMRHGSLLISFNGVQIDVGSRVTQGGSPKQERRRLEDLFRSLDENKDGILERREAFRPPFAIVPYLRLADRNGDGKVTWQEWSSFLDLYAGIGARGIVMSWVDRGRRLFDLLDADHDGRLTRRELLAARSRLAPFARNGRVSAADLPEQVQLFFQMGRPMAMLPANSQDGTEVFGPGLRQAGPLWFRKMDRNRDGDVTPREFLGTAEQFKKIDADGDGLIDAAEAERGDAWYRQQRSGPD
jgi:Ca2+-binding EF-hand superfamily protein